MTNAAELDRLKDHFRGALVGTFAGDALGAPVEGWSVVQIKREYGELRDIVAGRRSRGSYTDDTELMICLAEGLLDEDGALELDSIAERFAQGFDPLRGYGGNALQILTAMRAGAKWPQAAAQFKPPGGSFGNGSAMRAAPIALACFPDARATATAAARQGAVTGHSHPLAEFGAVAQALAVLRALERGWRCQPWDGGAFVSELQALEPPNEYLTKLSWLHDHVGAPAGDAIANLGNGVRAHDSVLTSLWAQSSWPDSAERAIIAAVNLGGDADTLAAMTGAVAGAYHGMSALPARWLERLEVGERGLDYVIGLADDLFVLASDRLPAS